jgi:hypothetical protein
VGGIGVGVEVGGSGVDVEVGSTGMRWTLTGPQPLTINVLSMNTNLKTDSLPFISPLSFPVLEFTYSTLPSWCRPDTPTGHDRFRQIFLDHWHPWRDLRLNEKVPPDQRAYVDKIVQTGT